MILRPRVLWDANVLMIHDISIAHATGCGTSLFMSPSRSFVLGVKPRRPMIRGSRRARSRGLRLALIFTINIVHHACTRLFTDVEAFTHRARMRLLLGVEAFTFTAGGVVYTFIQGTRYAGRLYCSCLMFSLLVGRRFLLVFLSMVLLDSESTHTSRGPSVVRCLARFTSPALKWDPELSQDDGCVALSRTTSGQAIVTALNWRPALKAIIPHYNTTAGLRVCLPTSTGVTGVKSIGVNCCIVLVPVLDSITAACAVVRLRCIAAALLACTSRR